MSSPQNVILFSFLFWQFEEQWTSLIIVVEIVVVADVVVVVVVVVGVFVCLFLRPTIRLL